MGSVVVTGNILHQRRTMSMCLVLRVTALGLILLVGGAVGAFSSTERCFHSRRSSRIWMGAARKQSAASEMALKIGLNIAPKGSTNKNDMGKKKKGHKATAVKDQHVVPVISWGSAMERFFWGEKSSDATPSPGGSTTMHQINNKESFPLILLRGALSAESLASALSLTADDDAEEIEQHELLVGGKVRALRRSLVSQLDPNGELLDEFLSNLPVALGEDHHPYEDGSVVYYRTQEGDFYDEHHDSFCSGETPRDRQRAYTILIYLRTPPGPPSVGGTEFTRLTSLTDDDDTENVAWCAVESRKDGRGLLVKPSTGDALVWPNFDRDGNPYMDSVHRALPVAALTTTARKKSSGSEEDGIGKVVVNLWFEGFTKSQNSQSTKKAKKQRNRTK
jgi:hypothetical protein